MSNYVFLSHVLRKDSPSYGDRDRVVIRVNSSISAGETANSSCLILTNNHIGTHIDVPRHFSNSGKRTIDYPADYFVFHHALLLDIPCDGPKLIQEKDFENVNDIDEDADLLLIRTGFEKKRQMNSYWNQNPGLHPDLADYLRRRFRNLRCLGFDFISITSWLYRDEGKIAHRNFLCPPNGDREILVIEDASLKNAPKNLKQVTVSPLLVEDGNGAPVTIIGEY